MYVITAKDNLNIEEAEKEQSNLIVNSNSCVNVMDISKESIEHLNKVNTIKVNDNGEEKSLYSRTYTKENKFNYNPIKCKEYYEKNKEKRIAYSKAYYDGLKQKAKNNI